MAVPSLLRSQWDGSTRATFAPCLTTKRCHLPPPNAFSRAAAAPKLAIIQVWMERAGAERSLVIELMERPDVTDAESAALHFDELASGNDALRSAVVSSQQLASKPERLGCDPPCFSVCGSQTLADGEGAECQLQVHPSTLPGEPTLDAPRIPIRCCSRCSCLSPGLPRRVCGCGCSAGTKPLAALATGSALPMSLAKPWPTRQP